MKTVRKRIIREKYTGPGIARVLDSIITKRAIKNILKILLTKKKETKKSKERKNRSDIGKRGDLVVTRRCIIGWNSMENCFDPAILFSWKVFPDDGKDRRKPGDAITKLAKFNWIFTAYYWTWRVITRASVLLGRIKTASPILPKSITLLTLSLPLDKFSFLLRSNRRLENYIIDRIQ